MSAADDLSLVRRAQRGDAEAFRDLVVRHQDRIYTAVLRFCGNAEDAADVTQRAFINAFRSLASFKGDSAFSTWIYRIAFNQSVSFRRESGRQRTISLEGRDQESTIEPVDDRSPGARMETDDSRRKVQEALNRLDPEDRKIIVLKELEEKSYEDIAGILGIPKGTVRSRLFRARQALRDHLKAVIGTRN